MTEHVPVAGWMKTILRTLLRSWQAHPIVRWSTAALVVIGISLTVTSIGRAQTSPTTPVLDGIAMTYQAASQAWLSRLLPVAQRTFTSLAALEFILSGSLWLFRRDAIDELAGRFLLKFILMSFMLTLITSFTYWVPAIVGGFTAAGQRATGLAGLSPSGVLEQGWYVSVILLDGITLQNLVMYPVTAIFIGLIAFGMWIAFVVVAAQLLRVLVESYLILTGGVIFLGLAAWRGTAAYAENYLNYAVAVGIKIFVLYLIVGVGSTLASTWSQMLRADTWSFTSNSTVIAQVFGGAVLFAALAVSIPGAMAHRITATHSFGVAHALRNL